MFDLLKGEGKTLETGRDATIVGYTCLEVE